MQTIEAEFVDQSTGLAIREPHLLARLEHLGRQIQPVTPISEQIAATVANAISQSLNHALRTQGSINASATGAGAKATVDFSGMTINIVINYG